MTANCFACSGPVGDDGLTTADDLADELAARTAALEACRRERDAIRERALRMAGEYGRDPLIGGVVASALRVAVLADVPT